MQLNAVTPTNFFNVMPAIYRGTNKQTFWPIHILLPCLRIQFVVETIMLQEEAIVRTVDKCLGLHNTEIVTCYKIILEHNLTKDRYWRFFNQQ